MPLSARYYTAVPDEHLSFPVTTAKEVQAHRADGGFLQHVASIPYTLQSWQGLRTRGQVLGRAFAALDKPRSRVEERQGKARCVQKGEL